MKKYIIRRLINAIFTFYVVIFIVIGIFILTPADYLSALGPGVDLEYKKQLRHELKLDRPKSEQYFEWIKKVSRGDLGYCFSMDMPTNILIKATLKNSYKLYALSFISSLALAIPIGVMCAQKQNSTMDYVLSVFNFIGLCMPVFVIAAFLKVIFVNNRSLEFFSFIESNVKGGYMEYSFIMLKKILPFIVMVLTTLPLLTRYIRSSMIDVLRENYINTARAKGLKERVVNYKHAFRNANISVVTIMGMTVTNIISWGFLTEYCFGFDGLGNLTYYAASSRDYPLMIGLAVVLCGTTLLINFTLDILYSFLDPRIRMSSEKSI